MADIQETSEKQLLIQKLYIKDVSFESPKTPEIFLSSGDTEILLNVRSTNREIDPDILEVTLTVSVKSVIGDDPVFLIEVEQAGVFEMKGYTREERLPLLGSVCPGALYPYARETITQVANLGGFQDVLVQPIDFDTLFRENMRERAAQQTEANAVAGSASES